jgi:L-alanine-DL-glutamate epimerase-like enolase superfamily enzyme
MRISGVDAIAIDIPLTKNFGGSTYAVLKRSTVITRLRTQDGLVSEVYNGDNRESGREIVRLIRDELAPLIKGDSIFATERIWSKLFALTSANRDRKTLLEAIACIDCAVWDVIGKATGRSVRELLGGLTRSRSFHRRLLHGGRRSPTSAARWRSIGRHGGLQIQGRGSLAAGRCRTRGGCTKGRGLRFHTRGRCQSRLDGR